MHNYYYGYYPFMCPMICCFGNPYYFNNMCQYTKYPPAYKQCKRPNMHRCDETFDIDNIKSNIEEVPLEELID